MEKNVREWRECSTLVFDSENNTEEIRRWKFGKNEMTDGNFKSNRKPSNKGKYRSFSQNHTFLILLFKKYGLFNDLVHSSCFREKNEIWKTQRTKRKKNEWINDCQINCKFIGLFGKNREKKDFFLSSPKRIEFPTFGIFIFFVFFRDFSWLSSGYQWMWMPNWKNNWCYLMNIFMNSDNLGNLVITKKMM